jgi:hypothetical protein
MRLKPLMWTAVALAIACAGLGSSAIAAPSAEKKVTCTLHLQSLAAPSDPTGEAFGTSSCSGVFGSGLMHLNYTATTTSATTASVTGPFKQYYDTGTVHGTFKLTLNATASGAVTYTGTATISGGTGAYKLARGSGKLTGSATDAHHSTFSYHVTLTHR